MSATRFAPPSPTGYLHQGHAFSALTAFETARRLGGRFVLRIEDIDFTRCRPQFVAAIYQDLAWLGLAWERPVRRQSEHLADYAAALEQLRAAGLGYRCFATRKVIAEAMLSAPHGAQAGYRGAPLAPADEAARLAAGEPFAWRLNLAAAEAAAGPLSFLEAGEGPPGERGGIAGRRRARPATWCWRARMSGSPTTSPSWSTTRASRSPTSYAGRTCSKRPTCSGCCRRCLDCQRRATTITG